MRTYFLVGLAPGLGRAHVPGYDHGGQRSGLAARDDAA